MMKNNTLNFITLALAIPVLIFGFSGPAQAVIDCDCDLAIDDYVDINDLGVLVDNWLVDCSIEDCNGADLDDSNSVNFDDFGLFAQYWMTDLADSNCLWTFIQQQWTNTMTLFTTDPNYDQPSERFPRGLDKFGEYVPTTNWYPKGQGGLGYVHWAGGFIPGSLWYLYQKTGDESFKDWAETWTWYLEFERNRTKDHEAGFTAYRSFGFGYHTIGDANYVPVLMDAAENLMTRYDANVGCIRSWNSYNYPVITDGLMMLELVFWAIKNGGDPTWYDKLISHSYKTMENNVRPNGSSWQIVDYNPTTGGIIRRWSKQGIDHEDVPDDTTWSRGQAWGINGFTMVYREANDVNFLNTAKSMADYFIDHLEADYMPLWDFNAPDYPAYAEEVKDTSAAAIAASGLLELSTLVPDQADKEKYYNAAINILDSLSSPTYLNKGTGNMGLLQHQIANGNRPWTNEYDTTLMYGDHFFIEALLRKESIPPP